MRPEIPAGYVGSVDDAVVAARFHLSDDVCYVTGSNIHVSDGWGSRPAAGERSPMMALVPPGQRLARRARRALGELVGRFGFRIVRRDPARATLPHDIAEEDFQVMYRRFRPYTMTSMERMYALYKATQYVVSAGVPGDLVECGVWRGGSALIMAETLLRMKERERNIYLYDTYAGMPEPGPRDTKLSQDLDVRAHWQAHQRDAFNEWGLATLDEVRQNMKLTRYPEENLAFIRGRVEETIPAGAPARIALLRLDTDWYESTLHELTHLYPRLAPGGVLLLDDYGAWAGAREATDQYLREHSITLLMVRLDYTGRIAVKPPG